MSSKIPGILSREEKVAGQLKAKKRNEEFRLKVEKEMTERAPKGLFWRVPEYNETTTTEIKYRCVKYKDAEDVFFEKIKFVTFTTWRHNGDEQYVFVKKERKQKVLEARVAKTVYDKRELIFAHDKNCQKYFYHLWFIGLCK